jgi:signal transduction histidine kinase
LYIKNWVTYFVSIVCAIVCVQLAFLLIQKYEAERALEGIFTVFRSEEIASNPFRITAELQDLVVRKVIQCPRLQIHGSGELYLDRSDLGPCDPAPIRLLGLAVSRSVHSISNQHWDVTVTVPNSRMFYLALWCSRAASILLILMAVLFVQRMKMKIHSVQQVASAAKQNVQLIEDMTRQVAHDLRSPLSAISLLTSRPTLSEDEKSIMISASKRLNRIASEVLKFHKIEKSDRNSLCFRSDIVNLIGSVVGEKRLEVENRPGIEIRFKAEINSLKLNVNIADDLARVLSNLINNSIEALPPTGGVIQINLSQTDGEVVLLVEDFGVGISDYNKNSIGERGWSTKRDMGGSGLGVFHAKRVLANWNGRLEISSEVGKGTLVCLRIPTEQLNA